MVYSEHYLTKACPCPRKSYTRSKFPKQCSYACASWTRGRLVHDRLQATAPARSDDSDEYLWQIRRTRHPQRMKSIALFFEQNTYLNVRPG